MQYTGIIFYLVILTFVQQLSQNPNEYKEVLLWTGLSDKLTFALDLNN